VSRTVLDASAVLAVLKRESGAETVIAAVAEGAAISAVNLAEIVSKLADWGMDGAAIRGTLDNLDLDVVDFDAELAYAAGLLRPATRAVGLSPGDRACVALARRLGAEALTADRTWADLKVDVPIRMVR
jgi:PIN domain nuclease of toxin-antitoxin system